MTYGLLEVLKLVLAPPDADLELRNSSGSTAMLLACYYGFDDLAIFLIEKGADVNNAQLIGYGYNGGPDYVTPLLA